MLGIGVESFRSLGLPQDQDDWILDLEVTSNRPDCLGHLGVARELAAAFGNPFRPRPVSLTESRKPAVGAVSIEIEDPAGCARYCGRVIQNVRVQRSPDWLAQRLEAVGVRSINNVADATNYVLMELGHPLHAFDLDGLRGRKIVVRRAGAGEKLCTLDGVERTLAAEDLVIADAERAVALAGVMGGEDSEIAFRTCNVLLESAWFEPVGVRRTSKRHGLHTEASHRFERGADIEMARQAIDRTAALIAELAGGEVLEGVIDVYPNRQLRPPIVLRPSEILRHLGAEITRDEVESSLSALGFSVEPLAEGGWRVTPPSFRLDVTREIDLIEELARLYGYDRLPARLRPAPPSVERDHLREKELAISRTLVGLGYREIIVPSMVDPGENARFTEQEPVRLANPLTQDASALRSTSVPGMLRALRWNLDRGQSDLRLFEFGKVYTTSERTGEGLPAEHRVLTLGASGWRRPAGVHDATRAVDIFDLKGDLEVLVEMFDLPGLDLAISRSRYHEAEVGGRLVAQGRDLVRFGQLSHEIAREYKLRQPVYIAEVDLERLLAAGLRRYAFRPFSKFPAVERDLSLVLPISLSYGRIAEALKSQDIGGLQEFRPVDRFEGGALPVGHYSLLLRVMVQSADRTLTSEEVDKVSHRILEVLQPLGVSLRTA